jgi:hypothetical protein
VLALDNRGVEIHVPKQSPRRYCRRSYRRHRYHRCCVDRELGQDIPRLHIVDGPRSPELSKKPAETVVRDVRRDPEKTTQALLKAGNNRDQDTALKLAEESAVNKLFSASAETLKVSSKELTCYLAGTGQRHCQIAGVLNFTLIETDQGWWVKSVEY